MARVRPAHEFSLWGVQEGSLQLGGLENGRKTQTTPRPAPLTSLYLPTLLCSFLGWDAEFFGSHLHVPVYRQAAPGPAGGLPVLEAPLTIL